MSIRRSGLFALVIAASFAALPAFADDWVAAQLRGNVFVFVDGSWVQLHRGDVVPDRQVVRTQGNGRVTLVRGKESVAIGGNSQVEIVDRDGQQFTTVKQSFGTVEIEAEVRNVQHFAVVNPQLAAVVKGTHFTVTSTNGKGRVQVSRGHVAVENTSTHDSVVVAAGQSVTTGVDAPLTVASAGVPATTVTAAVAAYTTSPSTAEPTPNGNGNGNGGGNGNGNNGNGNGNGGGDGSNGHGNGSGGNNSGNGNGNGGDNSGHGNGNGDDNSGHGNGNGHSGHGN